MLQDNRFPSGYRLPKPDSPEKGKTKCNVNACQVQLTPETTHYNTAMQANYCPHCAIAIQEAAIRDKNSFYPSLAKPEECGLETMVLHNNDTTGEVTGYFDPLRCVGATKVAGKVLEDGTVACDSVYADLLRRAVKRAKRGKIKVVHFK